MICTKHWLLRWAQRILKGLRTKVMTPLEFGREMKLLPVSPIVFSYTDADFLVRADVSWPDGARQGGRFRRKQ